MSEAQTRAVPSQARPLLTRHPTPPPSNSLLHSASSPTLLGASRRPLPTASRAPGGRVRRWPRQRLGDHRLVIAKFCAPRAVLTCGVAPSGGISHGAWIPPPTTARFCSTRRPHKCAAAASAGAAPPPATGVCAPDRLPPLWHGSVTRAARVPRSGTAAVTPWWPPSGASSRTCRRSASSSTAHRAASTSARDA